MIDRSEVIEVLRKVLDPELDLNIIDLGLVYRIDVKNTSVEIDFTLTYPGCPLGEVIQHDIVDAIHEKFGLMDVVATLVWIPMWGPERMSEEARVAMGYPI
jgi:metal-sulfur cluster biosynthetic enzyme